jgi:RNA polymerase sigma-70 factor (ECF subfamily)
VSDESRLIGDALRGDAVAFGELVRRHQDRLYNAIVHFIGDRTEAEDIVQDAFVQAYLKLATFHGNSAFYTWLYRIAFNTAVSRRRRRRAEASVEVVREQLGSEPEDSGDRPETQLERTEQAAQLYAALDRLSEEHRVILILREIDGRDYEAIAEILEINVGTVRSRLHRARTQLRDKLRHMQPE